MNTNQIMRPVVINTTKLPDGIGYTAHGPVFVLFSQGREVYNPNSKGR